MNLPDTNIWLSLAIPSHPSHSIAHEWFATQSRNSSVRFCRPTQQSFLRLLTTENVMQPYGLPAFTNTHAWQLLDAFLADPLISFAPEPPSIEPLWQDLASRNTPSPKLWMDAYLAAFAIAGNHRLITMDKAFSQFKNLKLTLLS